jgi:hypothetical protein
MIETSRGTINNMTGPYKFGLKTQKGPEKGPDPVSDQN